MNLTQLRVLEAVARHGSVTEAGGIDEDCPDDRVRKLVANGHGLVAPR
jgi:hypothetical protein